MYNIGHDSEWEKTIGKMQWKIKKCKRQEVRKIIGVGNGGCGIKWKLN